MDENIKSSVAHRAIKYFEHENEIKESFEHQGCRPYKINVRWCKYDLVGLAIPMIAALDPRVVKLYLLEYATDDRFIEALCKIDSKRRRLFAEDDLELLVTPAATWHPHGDSVDVLFGKPLFQNNHDVLHTLSEEQALLYNEAYYGYSRN